jgi:hypothetical protein
MRLADGPALHLHALRRRFPLEYRPAPRDTSAVEVPRPIADLTELLAKNTHENWAKQRMGEGWKYGPRRDDARKEHPSLVPYEDLSDSEKEYDRRTAIETVKTILSLGYRIEKR